MTARRAWQAILIGLVIVFGCGGVLITPVDRADYRDAVVKSAGSTLSAVQIVDQLCQARLQKKTLRPYERVVLADAREAVAAAQHEIARLDVPDRSSATLRDQLSPLLQRASAAVGNAGIALDNGDSAAIQTARHDLGDVADRLDQYIETYR